MRPVFRALNTDGTSKTDASDAFFVDSGLVYSGVAKTTFTGLAHLEGKEVRIMADGCPLPPQVVNGGTITLAKPASKVVIGLGYESYFETLPLDIPMQTGTTQAQKKRIVSAILRVLESIGGEAAVVTPDGVNWEPLLRDAVEVTPDSAPSLYTGDREGTFRAGSFPDAVLAVRQTDPLPLTVGSIIVEVEL
jgi:hypothetical protein